MNVLEKLAPFGLGLVLFLSLVFLGHYLQTSTFYIDGFFISILFTLILGLFYLKVLKLPLGVGGSLQAALMVYSGKVLIYARGHVHLGDSTAQAIVVGLVASFFTFLPVFFTLYLLSKPRVKIVKANNKNDVI